MKPISAIIVLLLVVASLLVSGCTNNTTNTTNTTNQTPSTTPSIVTRDAFLEKYLAAFKNLSCADNGLSYKAWEFTWTQHVRTITIIVPKQNYKLNMEVASTTRTD